MPIGMPPTYYEWAKMLVCEDEGQVLFVYDDATGRPVKAGDTLVGNPTIGYGRDLSARGITETECMVMLHGDLAADERAAVIFAGKAWTDLSAIRRAVLMSMAHILGAAGFVGFVRLRAAVEAGDWSAAFREIMDSEAARKAQKRYERLALMMRDNSFYRG